MGYATPEQLAASMRVQVTPVTEPRLQSCLDAAAEEIDHALSGVVMPAPVPELVVQVNIARAVEWWKASDAAFGALGFDNVGVLTAPRDGFARHHASLTPLLGTFGIA